MIEVCESEQVALGLMNSTLQTSNLRLALRFIVVSSREIEWRSYGVFTHADNDADLFGPLQLPSSPCDHHLLLSINIHGQSRHTSHVLVISTESMGIPGKLGGLTVVWPA